MKKATIVLGIIVLLIGGIFLVNSQSNTRSPKSPLPRLNSQDPAQNQDNAPVAVVAENLEVPWALAFLPDGSLLVTERPGRVRVIDKSGNLNQAPILELPVVQKAQGEGGLHGITIHPEFEQNRFVYLYYTYANQGSQSLNRVVRYTFDGQKLSGEKMIVDKIPGALFHDGGRIKFGPDELLYITTGDAQEPSLAQDRKSLAGKILRVTPDGDPAPNNPFGDLIYSYGHRNPQGITWDDEGNLWETEHGSSETDELNRIEIGRNYGWPEVRGDQTGNEFVAPIAHSGFNTWAPGGAAYLNGSIYFTGLRGESLYQAVLTGDPADIKNHFEGEFGRIRDVVVGPDKMLYVATSNRDGRGNPAATDDRILRINPQKL